MRPLHFAFVVLAMIFAASWNGAKAEATAFASDAQCRALSAADFSTVRDAPTFITAAKLVEATPAKPSYCEVEGYVTPQVGILMWLPASGWNGKFMQVGCGGFCGTTAVIVQCETPLRKGYACITTDMGHKGSAQDVAWASDNLQAVIDFAYRATHVTALAGKAITEKYYGRKPEKSYFHGCSCGGRQALVEAQRFPTDFDGIIVGAPGINYSDIMTSALRRAKQLNVASGKPFAPAEQVSFLQEAITVKCDINDGLKDGLIGDPRLCQFDPVQISCAATNAPSCLKKEQVTALNKIIAELGIFSREKTVGFYPLIGGLKTYLTRSPLFDDGAFFKYMGFVPNPGPGWKSDDFDFDKDPNRLGMIQSLLQADNPDLRKFKAAGGKLIFYHGWDDLLSPLGSIDYYEMVEKAMGGRATTEDFFRLFMVPDMDHCAGGNGAWSIDYLSYLEDWVERGKAPDVMIGAHFKEPIFAPQASDFPKAEFTRPVYPYPLRAHYKGSGDPNSAQSFKPIKSPR